MSAQEIKSDFDRLIKERFGVNQNIYLISKTAAVRDIQTGEVVTPSASDRTQLIGGPCSRIKTQLANSVKNSADLLMKFTSDVALQERDIIEYLGTEYSIQSLNIVTFLDVVICYEAELAQ